LNNRPSKGKAFDCMPRSGNPFQVWQDLIWFDYPVQTLYTRQQTQHPSSTSTVVAYLPEHNSYLCGSQLFF
jgi:hypothetical protein